MHRLFLVLIFWALIFLSSGCTLQVAPDGTRTWKADPETFVAVATIIAEK